MRWEDYPGLFRWAQCYQKGPYKREAEESESKNMGWQKWRLECCHVLKRPWTHKCRQPPEPGKVTESSLEPLEGVQLCQHFDFSKQNPFLTTHQCKIIKICCWNHWICGNSLQHWKWIYPGTIGSFLPLYFQIK